MSLRHRQPGHPGVCDIDGDGLIDGIGLAGQEQLNSDAATWIDQRPEFPSAYRIRPRTAGLSMRYTFSKNI